MNTPEQVHVLEGGLPLCGFTSETPDNWPDGHFWIHETYKERASCVRCLATLAVRSLELYAWVGEDELGSGEIGLKQHMTRAGFIPMVAIRRDKMDRPEFRAGMHHQSEIYGKKISLVRFVFAEVVIDEA